MNCPQCEYDGRGAVPYGRYKDHCDNCAAFEHGREAERVAVVKYLIAEKRYEKSAIDNILISLANSIKDLEHLQ